MPRVVHLAASLFDDTIGIIGGGERYVVELARHMAERTPTRLVTFGPVASRRTIGKLEIDIVRRDWAVGGHATNPFSLELFAHLRNSDVVHCYNIDLLATRAAAAFCKLTGRRAFVTNLGGSHRGTLSRIGSESWFHRHLHISRFSQELAGQVGSPNSEIISGGVDSSRFKPSDMAGEPNRVLFVGRILPHKGIDTLIRALPEGLHLDVVGRPYDADYLCELRTRAAGKPVTFITDLDDAGLVAAYQRSACVVLPSVHTSMYGHFSPLPELLGQTLLEGMACGKPVICSSAGSMQEIVEDGLTGFVFTSGDVEALRDRLAWIRDHPGEARAMGASGRRRVVTTFTWESVVDRCLNAYVSPPVSARIAPADSAAKGTT